MFLCPSSQERDTKAGGEKGTSSNFTGRKKGKARAIVTTSVPGATLPVTDVVKLDSRPRVVMKKVLSYLTSKRNKIYSDRDIENRKKQEPVPKQSPCFSLSSMSLFCWLNQRLR